MYKIIIFTHGTLSKGLLNTSSLIVGEQPEIEAFSVELGCDLQDLKEQVSKSLKKAEEEGKEVLVLTDLMYGTPFNTMVELQKDYKFYHITGVNLPMLLEAINSRNEGTLAEMVENIIQVAKTGVVDVQKLFDEMGD